VVTLNLTNISFIIVGFITAMELVLPWYIEHNVQQLLVGYCCRLPQKSPHLQNPQFGKKFHKIIQKISGLLDICYTHVVIEDRTLPSNLMQAMKECIEHLDIYFLEHYKSLGELFVYEDEKTGRTLRENHIMHLFWVICRLRTIVNWSSYQKDMHSGDGFGLDVHNTFSSSELVRKRLILCRGPVLCYPQSRVYSCLESLLQKWKDLTYTDQLVKYVELLECRASMFFGQAVNEETFDMEDFRAEVPCKRNGPKLQEPLYRINRDCWFYFTTMFYHLKRSLWIRGRLIPRYPVNDVPYLPDHAYTNLHKWIEGAASRVTDDFAQRCRRKFMNLAARPGDVEWFAYKYPHMTPNISTVLREMRSNLYRNVNEKTSVDPVEIVTSKEPFMRRFREHLYLRLVGNWFLTRLNINWYERYVVENSEIEKNVIFILNEDDPLLIETFSTFEVYYQKAIYPCASTEAAILLWFNLVHNRESMGDSSLKNDIIEEDLNISDFYNILFEHPEHKKQQAAAIKPMELLSYDKEEDKSIYVLNLDDM